MDVIFISLKDIDSGKHFKSYIITFLVTFLFFHEIAPTSSGELPKLLAQF